MFDGEELRVMTPSKRNFTTRGSSTTEAALLTRGASQLYISLGDTSAEGALAVERRYAALVSGTTHVEVKSGYGLDFDSERRMLRVARRIGEMLGITVRRPQTCVNIASGDWLCVWPPKMPPP